ncbi:hypothetical protein F4782DRAFT_492960 [Xylaria castorea]|nr:hypothetical protein F4782DRAFT_492960 [Xylaria castorea]
MLDLQVFRARWDLLRTLHPLFLIAESLPTVDAAAEGQYGHASVDDVDRLKNEITMLRNDFKLNIIKQQQLNIDQVAEDISMLEDLHRDLQSLLEELDGLINPQVLDAGRLESAGCPESLLSFPRLVMIQTILRKLDYPKQIFDADFEDQTNPKGVPVFTFFADPDMASRGAETSWNKMYSHTSVEHVSGYILFPQDTERIGSCRRIVSHFGMVLDRLVGDSVDLWAMKVQMLDYTPQDVEVIKNAYDFASTCSSLFEHIANSTECGTLHQARLDLCGFEEDRLRMNICTCQKKSWVPALFTRLSEKPSQEEYRLSNICSPSLPTTTVPRHLHFAFNSDGIWDYPMNSSSGFDVHAYFDGDQYIALDKYLTHQDLLTPKFRKLVGVLLASSLFHLSDSPWIEQHLSPDTIFVPSPNNARLQNWCPQIICTLLSKQKTQIQSDHIAAFGVLVLELEADRQAPWSEMDNDCISGEKSNQVRLARILKSWEDLISDDYRGVAKACLEFDSLIEILDHPDIMPDNKALAVIYKCILEPLVRHLSKSFGRTSHLFKGRFGRGHSLVASMSLSSSTAAKRALFDDDESSAKPDDQISAARFLNDLKPFFKNMSTLRETISLTTHISSEKVRIVVLDSGIDDTDTRIRAAIKHGRINDRKSRSFVGQPNQWQDTHGHGTHVTRLLLETAPAAEIIVGKICTGKMINDEFMPRIAEAIQWAVDDCDAHIISLSFGFEEENDAIDTAVDIAMEAGKLVFAAASNNGGVSGRARPARHEGVICIHASDGKGNKGGMNPTPIANRDNFAILGVAVPSKWKGKEVWKTGTSFATPIAAGIAANVLEFAYNRCVDLKPRRRKLLHQKRGMQAIFRQMAEERDGYDFIHPARLWKDWQDPKTERGIAKAIEDILQDL